MTMHDIHGACGCGASGAAVNEADARRPEQEAKERQAPRRAYLPAVDLLDSEAEAVLVVDIPGVPADGVDLNMERNVLTLTAVPADGVIAGKTSAHSEYGAGEYRRSFALSDDIDKDGIGATVKDGVLRVRLPKRVPAAKRISVVAN